MLWISASGDNCGEVRRNLQHVCGMWRGSLLLVRSWCAGTFPLRYVVLSISFNGVKITQEEM